MKHFSLLVLIIMLAGGCKKDDTVLKFTNYANLSAATTKQFDGTYNGQFVLTQSGAKPVNLTVQLVISGNQFKSGITDSFSDLGQGTFLFNDKLMNFENIQAYPGVISQGQEYPYGISVIAGNYNYTIKGDSLILSQVKLNGAFATYKLRK